MNSPAINDQYTISYLHISELLRKARNETYHDQLINIISKHRGRPVKIIELVIEYFNDRENKKSTIICVVENNQGHIIGITRITYNKKINTAYLSMVNVLAEYRGRGICKKMIKMIVIRFNLKNIKLFKLGVLSDNISAIKCYENNGFKIVSHHDNMISMELNSD